MDIVTNSFCAGGTVLGNGTWLNVGGNQAVKKGGDPADSQNGGGDYDDPDGGKSYVQCLISCAWYHAVADRPFFAAGFGEYSSHVLASPAHRSDIVFVSLINPCDDESCEWTMTAPMTTRRWYPTMYVSRSPALRALCCLTLHSYQRDARGWFRNHCRPFFTAPPIKDDSRDTQLGGCDWGGYVNSADQDNPTWEIFPPTDGDVVKSDILSTTLPVNLFPLTWMLPSGKIFLQSNWKTALLDYKAKEETPLDDMLDAVRVYPASGGSTMLPLTPDNNYTATLLFCGGSNLQSDQWKPDWNIAAYNASTSCVRITPDESSSYVQDDPLPEGRSMGNLILLPNGKILMLNGAETGTAGYGTQDWTLNESYADNPVLMPIIYDPSAAKGKRWSRDGLSPSTVPRMYHSGATLLPDGERRRI